VRPTGVDKNIARVFTGLAEFRRRNAGILLFRLDNKEDRTQALHVAGVVRVRRQIFLLFRHNESGLGTADRDPQRHDVRVGSRGDGLVLQDDLTAQYEPHGLGAGRSVRLHR